MHFTSILFHVNCVDSFTDAQNEIKCKFSITRGQHQILQNTYSSTYLLVHCATMVSSPCLVRKKSTLRKIS